jgi:hypothetical protein
MQPGVTGIMIIAVMPESIGCVEESQTATMCCVQDHVRASVENWRRVRRMPRDLPCLRRRPQVSPTSPGRGGQR